MGLAGVSLIFSNIALLCRISLTSLVLSCIDSPQTSLLWTELSKPTASVCLIMWILPISMMLHQPALDGDCHNRYGISRITVVILSLGWTLRPKNKRNDKNNTSSRLSMFPPFYQLYGVTLHDTTVIIIPYSHLDSFLFMTSILRMYSI